MAGTLAAGAGNRVRPASLVRGDKGQPVIVMTRRLAYLRSHSSGEPFLDRKRSVFDKPAERALRRFQAEHGLEVSGRFGPRSAKVLARAVAAEKRRLVAAGTPQTQAPAPPPSTTIADPQNGEAEPVSTNLLARLERLDARGDDVRAALLERRVKLERALAAERRRREAIERELESARPPLGVPEQPPSEALNGVTHPPQPAQPKPPRPKRPQRTAAERKARVAALQRSLNRFTRKYLKGVAPLAVDGIYGKRSKARVMGCKFYLGYTGKARHSAAVKRAFVRRLRHPHSRRYSSGQMLARAARRRRAQRHAHSVAKASGGGLPGNPAWAGSRAVAEESLPIMQRHGMRPGSTKRARQTTASGGVSDHWSGATSSYAIDIPTFSGAGLAQDLGRHYGFPFRPVGTFNGHTVRRGGRLFRIQVLWAVEGHFNHVHLGVKRVG